MKAFILLAIFLFVGCLSGCKFGGSWLKSSSPNIKVVSPNDLIKNPNGTYSLKKGNPAPKKEKVASKDIPQVINKPQKSENKTLTEKAQGKAAKSKPVAPPNSSAKPQPLPASEIKSAGEKSSLPPIEIVDLAMNVKPKNNNTGGKVDKSPDTVIINEEEMKIDWPGLILFYFIAIMILILSWMVYDLIKDFIYNKKRSQNPFTEKENKQEDKSAINDKKRERRAQIKE